MKKIFVIIILYTLFIPAGYAKTFTVREDIRIRKGAGTNYEEIGKIEKGTSVDITDVEDNWGKVDYHGIKGYVSTKFLDEAEAAPAKGETNWLMILGLVAIGAAGMFFFLRRAIVAKSLAANAKLLAAKKDELLNHVHVPSDGLCWYGCGYCGETAKSVATPDDSGCKGEKSKGIKSTHHLWYKLAALGETHYQCDTCGMLINAHHKPAAQGCYRDVGKMHKWEKM